MIETISTNENFPINKGEGTTPSSPPSSSEAKDVKDTGITTKSTSTEKATSDASVDLDPGLKDTLESDKSKESSDGIVEKELKETIERLNEKLGRLDREILLKVDKRIGKNYVSVIDKESKEVLREFPPKEIRSFIARFMEFNEKLAANTDIRSLIINLEV